MPRIRREYLRPQWILRDLGIAWVVTLAGGFAAGATAASSGWSVFCFQIVAGVTNLLLLTACLTLSGCMAPSGNRWAHLAIVSVCLWLTSLVNTFFGVSLLTWALGVLPVGICMAIGGGLSYLIRPDQKA